MTRAPRAFRSIAVLLVLWITGRALTMMPDIVEADAPASDEPERSATEDPAEKIIPAAPVISAGAPETLESSPAVKSPPSSANERRIVRTAYVQDAIDLPPRMEIEKIPGQSRDLRPPKSVLPGSVISLPGRTGNEFTFDEGWSASGWAMYRAGSQSTNGLAANGQLGGSQAGIRVRKALFDVGSDINIGGSVRASSALDRRGQREVAVGGSLRIEGRIPVEIIAEQRVGIDGGARDRFVLLAATGFDDLKLPAESLLSGYAQAGIAGVRSRDGFADGSVRIERPVIKGERYEVRAGANLWGAAQPGLSRVDVGPSVTLKLQALGPPMRISAEWRQRVAGNASPASGPAITIGADF